MAGMRIALVGAGNIADRYAAAIQRADGLELAGATDLDPARAEALVAEFGGKWDPACCPSSRSVESGAV